MNIGPTGPVGGPDKIEPKRKVTSSQPPSAPKDTGDSVEVSEAARFISEALQLPEVRQDKIDEIRRAIENGTYETDTKIQQALEKFIQKNLDLFT